MGVEDYVHSKEAPRPPTRDTPNQYRQLLAEQAKVDIRRPTFVAPIPPGANGRVSSEEQNGAAVTGQPHEPYEELPQGDMFDTDVEGVDDSTVAATTVLDPEEGQHFQPPPSRRDQHNDTNNRPLNHLRPGYRLYGSKWYENLGDKAIKTAGFDSDDAGDDASQLASSLADDDDKVSETTDWYYSHKHRPGEEPLSRRLENFWNASKKTYHKPSNPAQAEPNLPLVPIASEAKEPAGQVQPLAEGRKITLPRNHTATPRTRSRFSPPKPSLLEQLDITPTRGASGQRQPTGEKGTSPAAILQPHGIEDAGIFTNDNNGRENIHPTTAFDTTNMAFLDNEDDDTIQDPFSKQPPTKKATIGPTIPRKRDFEADYPPAILYQKSFSDLQAEPFDFTPPPAAAAAASPAPETQEQPGDSEDKFSLLLRLSDHDRANYLSNLSIGDWEECGDQLVDQFGQMLARMKDLRRARRKTAAVFEAEIKRRHELVDEQTVELAGKLDNMRNGGVEVLRGRGRS